MKVLLVRLSAIGDVVQGIPCLVALKESFPDWRLSWLVEETSAPLLENHPCLHRLFVLARSWRTRSPRLRMTDVAAGLENIRAVRRSLRAEHFDIAIDLQGLFKSGLWTWLSGAPRRLGHDRTREFAHCFLTEFVSDRPTFDPLFPLVQRYLEAARFLGADVTRPRYQLPPASPDTVAAVDALLGSEKSARPTIAFCPWSLWPSKNWPLEAWVTLAGALAVENELLLLGSHEDSAAAHALTSRVPAIRNLTGKTTVALLPEVFRRCRLVIGPDSGPLHIANATGGPRILMLFGSTSWQRSGPLGANHKALSLSLPCQPCFERICPLGHFHCQHHLSPTEVLTAARALLSDQPERSHGV